MFETLFGADTPLFVRFLVALVVVFGLIAATFWVVRRFSADRLNAQGTRNRQPRLAVIDAAAVDGRRRLVLIRRDNVEHLLIIGGPTDVVIEANIVRATAATRDATPARAPGEMSPRPPQLEDASSWPLQPEPAPKLRPSIPEDAQGWVPQPPEPARPPRASDALAGLAADLSAGRPMAQPPAARTTPPELPRVTPLQPTTPTANPAAPSTADQNLAEMASRLEAALRRPGAGPAPAKPDTAMPAGTQPAGPRTEPKPPQAKSPYGNLEQEMASLLSRPPGKT